ncbi:GTP-binding protein [Haloarcula sp. CBA1130]|uniref:CobW family GTP-binding protein n=1 Tax=unclassified Haloarcula TaxID=2624677 RepID=UPI001243C93E|nr:MULTISPECIES: GTP-binding protein [unclassified Haloarcula]KAA9399505.1 GTP-binding protein [Haloarcula sp. CBA1129]KAA9401229.1 GTP-binding protein [Haloarcula sp. CBA1130]
MRDTIPVTILSGSLGAGKTTLLNHLLTEAGDRDIAVLVNDMGTVNVDADLIAEGSELDVDDGVAELSNGCICCELQDDLETAVVRLANDRDFDALVVESSGISEPAPVARLFTTESRVAALYRVDTLVTVLDTRLFLDAFAGETPERRGTGGANADGDTDDADRPLSDLMVEQVELSNIVLLNKTDLCTDAELDEAEELVRALQPDAETVRTTFSQVAPDRLFDRELFDPDEINDLPGWKRALSGAGHGGDSGTGAHESDSDHEHDHHHPEDVYGVTSFTYRRRRPFHPGRLADVLRDLPQGVVRSKGTVWLAGNDCHVVVGQAGPSVRAEAQGPWIASLPEVERDMYRSNRPELDWHDEHGDRRTELVFIGTEYDEDALRTALDDALVTDTEWTDSETLTGPFPAEQGEETVIRSP